MPSQLDFSGRTIVVCGIHKGGMGGATCQIIAQGGGTIVAVDFDQGYLDDIAREVRELGGTIHTVQSDLTDIAACERLIPDVLARVGQFDGLVNIAGGTRGEEWMPLDETPGESFWKTLQLNFAYVFYLCRDAATEWIRTERPGAIVNVGSVSAKDAAPWHGPYGAAKSGIIALTRTMANEWHEFGIRANSVSPGAVSSERVAAKARTMSDRVHAGRIADPNLIMTPPHELAGTITFLLSDLAAGVSGQNITVDRSLSTRFCGGQRQRRKSAPATTAAAAA